METGPCLDASCFIPALPVTRQITSALQHRISIFNILKISGGGSMRSWNWICPKSTPRLPLVLSPTSKLILCVTFWPYSPDCPHITSQHPLPVLTWPYTSRDSNRFTNRNGHPTSQDIYYSNWAAINTDLFDVEANRPLIKTKWHRRNILCSMPPSFELPSQSMCG